MEMTLSNGTIRSFEVGISLDVEVSLNESSQSAITDRILIVNAYIQC